MERTQFYSRILPIAAIVYVIVMFLVDWNTTAVIVGAMLIALIAVAGNWVAPK